MNIAEILREIEKTDGDIFDRLNPRRKAMKDFFNVSKKITLNALPLALGSLFQKAYGQSSVNPVIESLNLALALEYLEFNFYNHALTVTTTLIPETAKPIFTTIRDHEQAHINLLIKTIQTLGGVPRPVMPYEAFDYTKINANVNTTYNTFLRTAMSLEDFGVRAYKGQTTILMAEKSVLAAALQIHSIEARHSAQLRKMVYDLQLANLKNLRPWPGNRKTDAGVADDTNYNDSTVGALSTIYYRDDATLANAENKTVQAGIQLTGIGGFTDITASAAAESFDEYLQTATVKTVANNLFLKTGYKLA